MNFRTKSCPETDTLSPFTSMCFTNNISIHQMEELETLDYCIIVPIEVFNMHGHYTESKHVIATKINASRSSHLRVITSTVVLYTMEYQKYAGLYSKYRLPTGDFTDQSPLRQRARGWKQKIYILLAIWGTLPDKKNTSLKTGIRLEWFGRDINQQPTATFLTPTKLIPHQKWQR